MLHDSLDTVASASYVLASASQKIFGSASHFLASASALVTSISGLINCTSLHRYHSASVHDCCEHSFDRVPAYEVKQFAEYRALQLDRLTRQKQLSTEFQSVRNDGAKVSATKPSIQR